MKENSYKIKTNKKKLYILQKAHLQLSEKKKQITLFVTTDTTHQLFMFCLRYRTYLQYI